MRISNKSIRTEWIRKLCSKLVAAIELAAPVTQVA